MPRPIRAEVNLAAFAHNLAVARRCAGTSKIWAVIKANAYGHGVLLAARALGGADGLAVVDFEDAVRLRDAGERRPILMLQGMFEPRDLPLIDAYALTPVVHHRPQIEMLRQAPAGAPFDVYLKVNSGMNRLGFGEEELAWAWEFLREHRRVRSVTFMTHFADADGPAGIEEQYARFLQMTRALEGSRGVPHSCANSPTLLGHGTARGDWVRPGCMLYGASSFTDRSAASFGILPALTVRSEVIAVRTVRAGEGIGYGFAHRAERDMKIGVVACGYADGYPRATRSGMPVLADGVRTRTLGRVSMDSLCIDLSQLPGAGPGTPVTIWGEGLPVDEVAAAAGTVGYDLMCKRGARMPVVEVA